MKSFLSRWIYTILVCKISQGNECPGKPQFLHPSACFKRACSHVGGWSCLREILCEMVEMEAHAGRVQPLHPKGQTGPWPRSSVWLRCCRGTFGKRSAVKTVIHRLTVPGQKSSKSKSKKAENREELGAKRVRAGKNIRKSSSNTLEVMTDRKKCHFVISWARRNNDQEGSLNV